MLIINFVIALCLLTLAYKFRQSYQTDIVNVCKNFGYGFLTLFIFMIGIELSRHMRKIKERTIKKILVGITSSYIINYIIYTTQTVKSTTFTNVFGVLYYMSLFILIMVYTVAFYNWNRASDKKKLIRFLVALVTILFITFAVVFLGNISVLNSTVLSHITTLIYTTSCIILGIYIVVLLLHKIIIPLPNE